MRWTQALMRDVAQEERSALGLGAADPFDPYALAEEHGIAVYTLSGLREFGLGTEALSLDPPTILWGVFPVQFLPEEFSQANPGVVAPAARLCAACP